MSDTLNPEEKEDNFRDSALIRNRSAVDDIDVLNSLPAKRLKVNTEDEEACNKLQEDGDCEEDDDVDGDDEDLEDGLDPDDIDGDYDNTNEEIAAEEVGESSDFDDYVQRNLSNINECQTEIEMLNKNANNDILKVEQKYNQLRQPVYAKRNSHIDLIPNFWSTAFSRHPQLRRVITSEDFECLKHLTRIQVEDFEDGRSGYRINFFFSNNSWFSNNLITKEYHLPWHDAPSCVCSTINWKSGMDLTKKEASFFSWFCSQDDSSTDDIAEIIKEELWTDPLPCYMMQTDEDESDKSIDGDAVVYDDDGVDYVSTEDEAAWGKPPALGKEAPNKQQEAEYSSTAESEEVDDDEVERFPSDDDADLLEVGAGGDKPDLEDFSGSEEEDVALLTNEKSPTSKSSNNSHDYDVTSSAILEDPVIDSPPSNQIHPGT